MCVCVLYIYTYIYTHTHVHIELQGASYYEVKAYALDYKGLYTMKLRIPP